MASTQPSCSQADERILTLADPMDTNQPSDASFKRLSHPLDASRNVSPKGLLENSLIIREALQIPLPPHLVLQAVQDRIRNHSCSYLSLRHLVADLFDTNRFFSAEDQEVPMETDQLEEAMMMNSAVVKKALKLGVPPHCIKPLVRARILSSGAGYTTIHELMADVNKE